MHKRAFRRRVGVTRAFLLQEEDRGKRKSKMDCAFPNRLGASRKTCSKPLENVCVGYAHHGGGWFISSVFLPNDDEGRKEGRGRYKYKYTHAMYSTEPSVLCIPSPFYTHHNVLLWCCVCGGTVHDRYTRYFFILLSS